MKNSSIAFILFAFILNLAHADWEAWDKKHFKKRVGKTHPDTFVVQEIEKLLRNKEEAFTSKTIHLEDASVEVHFSANRAQDIQDSNLIQMSYEPHIWIKRDLSGAVMEFGSSFMLSRDSKQNPRMIEQEVFYFQGKKASKSFIANW